MPLTGEGNLRDPEDEPAPGRRPPSTG